MQSKRQKKFSVSYLYQADYWLGALFFLGIYFLIQSMPSIPLKQTWILLILVFVSSILGLYFSKLRYQFLEEGLETSGWGRSKKLAWQEVGKVLFTSKGDIRITTQNGKLFTQLKRRMLENQEEFEKQLQEYVSNDKCEKEINPDIYFHLKHASRIVGFTIAFAILSMIFISPATISIGLGCGTLAGILMVEEYRRRLNGLRGRFLVFLLILTLLTAPLKFLQKENSELARIGAMACGLSLGFYSMLLIYREKLQSLVKREDKI